MCTHAHMHAQTYTCMHTHTAQVGKLRGLCCWFIKIAAEEAGHRRAWRLHCAARLPRRLQSQPLSGERTCPGSSAC